MGRSGLLLAVVVVGLVGIIASWRQPVAGAQEATPVGVEIGGVTFEPVAFAPDIALPSRGDLFVARASLDPGGVVPIETNDPALGILLVEAGTLTLQVEGPLMVTRGASLGEAMANADASGDFGSAIEVVSAGQVVILEAGDAAYIPAAVGGEIRNEGQEPAVRLAILVFPPDALAGEATPAR